MHQRDLLPVLDRTPDDTAYHDTTYIGVIVQCVGQHLQGLVRFHIRRRNRVQNHLEQRFQIIAGVFHG